MRRLKNIDLALLPTGDKYTMDDTEAAEAAIAIQPKTAMAMHNWDKNREEFKRMVEAASKTEVVLLEEFKYKTWLLPNFITSNYLF